MKLERQIIFPSGEVSFFCKTKISDIVLHDVATALIIDSYSKALGAEAILMSNVNKHSQTS